MHDIKIKQNLLFKRKVFDLMIPTLDNLMAPIYQFVSLKFCQRHVFLNELQNTLYMLKWQFTFAAGVLWVIFVV